MLLEDFFDYKNRLMEDLVTNPEIVKLLKNDCVPPENPKDLIYTQIFPYEYVPDTIDTANTFICYDVDISGVSNKTFLQPTIYLWTFTHRKLLRLPDNNGIRVDKLCSEIAKTLNGSRYYGLGELELSSVKRFSPFDGYYGRVMTFYAQEYNRVSPNNKSIPSHRKDR